MYEPQSRSRRYLNDVICENGSHGRGGGGGGGGGGVGGTPMLCVKGLQPRRNVQLPDCTCLCSHGHTHWLNLEPRESARTPVTSESAVVSRARVQRVNALDDALLHH